MNKLILILFCFFAAFACDSFKGHKLKSNENAIKEKNYIEDSVEISFRKQNNLSFSEWKRIDNIDFLISMQIDIKYVNDIKNIKGIGKTKFILSDTLQIFLNNDEQYSDNNYLVVDGKRRNINLSLPYQRSTNLVSSLKRVGYFTFSSNNYILLEIVTENGGMLDNYIRLLIVDLNNQSIVFTEWSYDYSTYYSIGINNENLILLNCNRDGLIHYYELDNNTLKENLSKSIPCFVDESGLIYVSRSVQFW